MNAVSALSDNDIEMDPNDPNDGSLCTGTQLNLQGATGVYLNFSQEVSSASINGKSASVTEKNGVYSVRISNIPSGYLSRKYTITVVIGCTEYTYKVSALSYCNSVLRSQDNTSSMLKLKNLCRSIYLYSAAADAYFHTGE